VTRTLVDLVEDRAREHGSKPLYDFPDGPTWSFADLVRIGEGVAGMLARAGVERGARVGVVTDDRSCFLAAFFGAVRRGAVPVPLGLHGRAGSEGWATVLRHRATSFGLDAVATDPPSAGACAAALPDTTMAVAAGSAPLPSDAEPVGTVLVQPSSGTTGEPKGVVLSQAAVLSNLRIIQETYGLDADDSLVTWLPLYHDMGLIGTALSPLNVGGATLQLDTGRFMRSPGRWLELLAARSATVAVAPPVALELAARVLARGRSSFAGSLAALKVLIVGADRLAPEVLDGFLDVTAPHGLRPEAVRYSYGLAEATLLVSATPSGRRPRVVPVGRQANLTCGPPAPGVAVRLDEGTDEILVRSPSLMDGYLAGDEVDGDPVREGWLHTGDVGAFDDGELLVVGRIRDMVNRNGVRVPPTDYELVAATVEGLRADRTTVFSCAHDGRESIVVLAEVLAADLRDETVLAVRRRLMEGGLPVSVVRLVGRGELPRTTSGKIQRSAARDLYVERFRPESVAR
jgi:acyl-CoA synthetase (AMP-forming)/AMP-acid ligase II